jgi:hypothetical protein
VANGDLAASVGMETVAGSEDINDGWDEDNKTRDYLAAHRLSGNHSASQITSGTLAIARGGTGTGAPYANIGGNPEPHRTLQRLLVVDPENVIRAASGRITSDYLGFRVAGGVAEDVDFDVNGLGVIEHGLSWTPLVVIPSPRLTSSPIILTRVVTNPTATVFGVRAWNIAGDPYEGPITQVEWIAWAVG